MAETTIRRGRIAMLYPHGAFFTLRALVDATHMLSDAGYQVDVYYRRTPDFSPDRVSYPGVSVTDDRPAVFTEGPVSYPSFLRRGTGVYKRLVSAVPHRLWRRACFLPDMRRRHAELPYLCIIGLDWHGLVAAGPLARELDVPLVYWSLELLFSDDPPQGDHGELKKLETYWSRQAAFTVIQDKWRAEAFVEENRVDPGAIVLVPNAPAGKARRAPSSLLRDRFEVDVSSRIAIVTGFLRPWAMSLEIAFAAAEWSKDYVLYLQSKSRTQGDTGGYTAAVIKAAAASHVLVGQDPVPAADFVSLVDSGDIGIALYNPLFRCSKIDRNLELMGHSSGKVADYLYSGLPVIASRLPGLDELIASSGSGLCVESPKEVGAALSIINNDYEHFSANACRCFDEKLELGRHFRAVLDRIAAL